MKFGAETPGLHGGIFFHQLSGFLDRRHLEDVEATQIAVVIKWSCGYELSFAVRPFDELKVAGARLFIFRGAIACPGRTFPQQAELECPHLVRRVGMFFLPLKIWCANSLRSPPGMHIGGVALFGDGGILGGDVLSLFERGGFEEKDAADGRAGLHRSGGHEDLVLHHFSDVGHVGLLDALGFRLRERFPVRDGPEKYEVVEVQIVTGRSGLATETGAKGESTRRAFS